jgi:hypothetical protein
LNKDNLSQRIKDNLLIKLNKNDIYATLINIQYNNNGVLTGTSPLNSFIITRNANPDLIAEKIHFGLTKTYYSYDIESEGSIVSAHWRNWLSEDQYSKLVEPVQRTQIINEVLEKEANLKLDPQSKIDKIMKFMNVDNTQNYLEKFPTFDSIILLPKYKFGKSDINFRDF